MRQLTPDEKKRHREVSSYVNVQQLLAMGLLFCSVLAVLAAPVPRGKPANYPAWWFSRGVIAQTDSNTNPSYPADYPSADDYAVVNEGQLKSLATAAYAELGADLPPYALTNTCWTNLSTLINGWNPANDHDDYATVNLGQLKTVSAAFYNVLISVGYTNNYPWTGVGADDYAVANIGQAKNIFSFDVGLDSDGSGMPNWWQIKYFGSLGNDPYSSPDGNGSPLLLDYYYGLDPTNYYSQLDPTTGLPVLITPTISISSGNSQTNSPSQYTDLPMVVSVTDSSGNPLYNAPVTFTVVSGGGQLAPTWGGATSGTLLAQTDGAGHAQAYYQHSGGFNVASQIGAATGGHSVTFIESTSAGDGGFDGPTGLTTSSSSPTEIDLTWVNHATTATGIVIQSSTDNATWSTVATLTNPATTNYAVTGLVVGQSYYFRIAGSK